MTTACEKLLLFGGLPSSYLVDWEITSDLPLAEARLGVKFEAIRQDEVRGRYDALDADSQREASRLAAELLDGASLRRGRGTPPPPSLDGVTKATRLYVTMRQITEERGGDAVTIACLPWIHGRDLPTPCVAMGLFQEQGIPAACQGDIDALLTMVLIKRATGQASFMGGAIKAQGHLGINHCVICRNLAGPECNLEPYGISTYHGRKDSPTVWADVPGGGSATVARLTRDLRQLLLLTGPLVGHRTDNSRCRNSLVVEVPDRERVFGAVKGTQNHYVVALGNHTQALMGMAADLGIEVLRLDHEGDA